MGTRYLKVWGVRGSMPVSNVAMHRYGGHTPCMEIVGESATTRILIDAGTGITRYQTSLGDPGPSGYDFHVFFTHFHLDHILGLPFFRPLYDERNRFTFYGYPWEGRGVQDILHSAFSPPLFPVALEDVPASLAFVEMTSHPVEMDGLVISSTRLAHPQGVTGYRVDGTRSIVIATDYERGDLASDAGLDELATGVDVLIHDAQYTPMEHAEEFSGWGHSTWDHAVDAAERAGAGRLVLISHDPDRTDNDLDALVEQARRRFSSTVAASEGMIIPLD